MDFSKYKGFRKKIHDDYGSYYKKYPNAILLLDFLIQLRVHSEFHPTSGVNDRDFEKIINDLTKSNLLTFAYNSYLYFASYFLKPYKNTFTIHSSIENYKFPALNQIFLDVSKKNQWKSIFHADIKSTNLTDILLLKKIAPYNSFVGSKTKKTLSKFRTSEKTIFISLLNDELLMKKLDMLVQKDINRSTKLIRRLSIDIFINTGDSSGNARVLNESIKNTGFKTISFSHGYISDPNLIGIAPIWSDKLILWTRKQKEEIEIAIDDNIKSKLAFIGYPKNYSSELIKIQEKKTLILIGPIHEMLLNKKSLAIFENVIESIKEFSTDVILRLHPHERVAEIPEIENFVKQNNIELSKNDLYSDICSSEYIFGSNTSTLVEAAYIGKKVYLIEDLIIPGSPKFDYEGTIKIKSHKINSIQRMKHLQFDETKLGFNKNEFSMNFEELIFSLFDKKEIEL
jgi:hypothetical protein